MSLGLGRTAGKTLLGSSRVSVVGGRLFESGVRANGSRSYFLMTLRYRNATTLCVGTCVPHKMAYFASLTCGAPVDNWLSTRLGANPVLQRPSHSRIPIKSGSANLKDKASLVSVCTHIEGNKSRMAIAKPRTSNLRAEELLAESARKPSVAAVARSTSPRGNYRWFWRRWRRVTA